MIEINHLSKSFRMGGETVEALKDVSLKIKDGEFVALVGPSGSGKTTLLNIIGGLESPTSGEITVDGENIAGLKDVPISKYRALKVGYVFQTFNLLARYTVLNNVMIPGVLAGTPKKDRKGLAIEALKAVGLENKQRYFPNTLSGGERQRVAIARALMHNPSIILADEPTGNLDEHNAGIIMDLLRSVAKAKKCILILVTHNPELAKLADRVIELRNGELHTGGKK